MYQVNAWYTGRQVYDADHSDWFFPPDFSRFGRVGDPEVTGTCGIKNISYDSGVTPWRIGDLCRRDEVSF